MSAEQASGTVTYLLTDYPAVSHTFIAEEIDALEALGLRIEPISINRPGTLVAAGDDERVARTRYLKGTPAWRVAAVALATVLSRPSVLGIPLRRGETSPRGLLWRYFHLVEAMLVHRAMRRTGSRHVHAHFGGTPATIAWFAAEIGRRRGERWTWSMTVHGWHEFVNEDAALLRRKLAAADAVVCISDFTRSQLWRIAEPEHWGKVHVVRCGIDLERFRPRDAQPTGDRVAIVARLSPEKGHLVLFEAVARLTAQHPELHVDVVGPGSGPFVDLLHERAAALGIADRVTWHGPLSPDAVADVLAGARAFCLPTFAEGLPIVLMEAMARGVPVVTTYIAGIPELVVDGVTGRVVPAARADLLADALDDAMSGTRAADVTNAARQAVADRHDIRANAPVLAEVLRPLAGGAS